MAAGQSGVKFHPKHLKSKIKNKKNLIRKIYK